MPYASGVNVGELAAALERAALLPAGRERSDHWYRRGSSSASLLPVPSRVTVSPGIACRSGPADATGAWFATVMTAVAGALGPHDSRTKSVAKYSPLTSGTKLGDAPEVDDSAALLPAGVSSLQE